MAENKSKADAGDEWGVWWDARIEAMEAVLGPSHDLVGHATIPFDLGADIGGGADIVYFHQHIDGVVSVTCELIGNEDQVPNLQGAYELMVCHRTADETWGANVITRLAYYTCRARIDPGETMDIGEAAPEGSSLVALLFFDYARMDVRGTASGLLLCVGITDGELALCRQGRRGEVEAALNRAGVFPYTDLYRESCA